MGRSCDSQRKVTQVEGEHAKFTLDGLGRDLKLEDHSCEADLQTTHLLCRATQHATFPAENKTLLSARSAKLRSLHITTSYKRDLHPQPVFLHLSHSPSLILLSESCSCSSPSPPAFDCLIWLSCWLRVSSLTTYIYSLILALPGMVWLRQSQESPLTLGPPQPDKSS